MRLKKIIKILPFLILGILSIFSMKGKIAFGFGLGDIVYHGLVYLGFIIYGIYFFVKKENPQKIDLRFPIISLLFCAYLILTMTIWRGSEYRWDGSILYSMKW